MKNLHPDEDSSLNREIYKDIARIIFELEHQRTSGGSAFIDIMSYIAINLGDEELKDLRKQKENMVGELKQNFKNILIKYYFYLK